MKKILCVIGTRPNYIKVTQLEKAFASYAGAFDFRMLHTGQHYDAKMKDVFFEQLGLQKIDYALHCGEGNPNHLIGNIILKMDEVLQTWKPDLVLVVGDVNSTLAAAIATNKAGIKLAHIESGLRSFDSTMPEEFNRIVTDDLSNLFFVTEPSGKENLLREGKNPFQIFEVGNTMIDTLVAFDSELDKSVILDQLHLEKEKYILITMHRPSNVDSKEQLIKMASLFSAVGKKYKLVFPIHPRTRKQIAAFGIDELFTGNTQLTLLDPLDYFSFQKLVKHCKLVITDSGGIQEETTFRKIPCLTLRENTERPVTISQGTNELIAYDEHLILKKIEDIENGNYKKGTVPTLWDGKASERIVAVIAKQI